MPWPQALPEVGQLTMLAWGKDPNESHEDIQSHIFQAVFQGHSGDPQDKRRWSVK